MKAKVPDNWKDVPKLGTCIASKSKGSSIENGFALVAARVPLDKKFRLSKRERWTPNDLLRECTKMNLQVNMVIDLTNTKKYYDGDSAFGKKGIQYVKLKVEGFADVPSEKVVQEFFTLLNSSQLSRDNVDATNITHQNPSPKMDIENMKNEKKPVVVVHCTHGLNRTGYLIVRYLVDVKKMSVKEALQEFTTARPPGLIKHMYIEKLYQMFDQIHDMELPKLPVWAEYKYDRAKQELENSTQRKFSRLQKKKLNVKRKHKDTLGKEPLSFAPEPKLESTSDKKETRKKKKKARKLSASVQ